MHLFSASSRTYWFNFEIRKILLGETEQTYYKMEINYISFDLHVQQIVKSSKISTKYRSTKHAVILKHHVCTLTALIFIRYIFKITYRI